MALTLLKLKDVKKVAKATFEYAREHPKAQQHPTGIVHVEAPMIDLILHGAKLCRMKISKGNREQVFNYLIENQIMEIVDHNGDTNSHVIKVAASFDNPQEIRTVQKKAVKTPSKHPTTRIAHKSTKKTTAPAKKVEEPSSPEIFKWDDGEFLMPAEDLELLLFIQEKGCIEDKANVYNVISEAVEVKAALPGKFGKLDKEYGFVERLINGKRTQMVALTRKGQAFLESDNLLSQFKAEEMLPVVLEAIRREVKIEEKSDVTLTEKLNTLIGKSISNYTPMLKRLAKAGVIRFGIRDGEPISVKWMDKASPHQRAVAHVRHVLGLENNKAAKQPEEKVEVVTTAVATPAPTQQPVIDPDQLLSNTANVLDDLGHYIRQVSQPTEDPRIQQISDTLSGVQSGNIGAFAALDKIEQIINA